MFSAFSLPFSLPTFGWGRTGPANLPSVPIHETETASDKPSKRLHSLIKLNHANHSIIFHDLRFHNHTPHVCHVPELNYALPAGADEVVKILGSSYILGATPDQLTKIYESESESLEPWRESPSEISKDDWRDYLGKREYQRAYVDFFEDQLVSFGYDWKKLLEHYLYSGKEPLINSLVSGLGHPLIHLGYGYEIGSRHVAIEALALGTCFYDSLHKYIDDPSYTRPSTNKTTSVLTILDRVRNDTRLDGLVDHLGSDNIPIILAEQEAVLLEHWNAWDVTDATLNTSFFEAQKAAVALVVATPDHPPTPPPSKRGTASSGTKHQKHYDFFLVHALTTSHAIRILLPLVQPQSQIPLARSWFLFALLAYIGQRRPRIDLNHITDFPLSREGEGPGPGDAAKTGKSASWEYVRDQALNGPHATDPHYVKALRACWVAEETWGDDPADGGEELAAYWRKAGVRMAGEFLGWGGFDAGTAGYQAGFY